MKIRPNLIFTVLGNAMSNIKAGYINDNQVCIPLDLSIVNECLSTSNKTIDDGYVVNAVFDRQCLSEICAEDADEEREKIELIDFDELFEYLENTDTDYIFKLMCSSIFTNSNIY